MTESCYHEFNPESYQDFLDKRQNPSNSSHVTQAIDLSASGSILKSNSNKVDDLSKLLESNKDSSKLEAMKKIISMIAAGKDCSSLFPSVVKIIFNQNYEIKKLVYVYLTRYAEEKEDLALLSISSFQKALKDSNQLIRASALRILSSIKIDSISPLILQAIKDCSVDISAYVRKTAAHAIPKLFSLDASLKDDLVLIISKLLGDKTTLVLGSAMIAFEEVCPERIDLIHINYRKVCQLVLDVDEWGQVTIINCLTRYCRSQFISPEKIDQIKTTSCENQKPKEETEEENKENDSSEILKDFMEINDVEEEPYVKDYRLLMACSRPLLQSRNSAVALSVCQLLYHCGSKRDDLPTVVKTLIRLLSESKEVQAIVLENIATIISENSVLFENHLKQFFVFDIDPLRVKIKKLSILTQLGNESNSAIILREFQAYVNNSSEEFVKEAIRSIGKLALKIPSVCETCLAGLVRLISRNNQIIVSESIIVLRSLLQLKNSRHSDVIKQLTSMLDVVTTAEAKSAIFWLVGEYSPIIPQLTPDILREMAKKFVKQEVSVKYQILNLAAKLYVSNNSQCKLLVEYIFEMAKYDSDYDVRDKTRMLKFLCSINSIEYDQVSENIKSDPSELSSEGKISRKAKRILLSPKPLQETMTSVNKPHSNSSFRLGSLSHYLSHEIPGYQKLQDWPETPPNPSVRNVPVVASDNITKTELSPNLHHQEALNEGKRYEFSLSEDEDFVVENGTEILNESKKFNPYNSNEDDSVTQSETESSHSKNSMMNALDDSITESSSDENI